MKEEQIKKLVDRFLAWPLPKSVSSDTCVTVPEYQSSRSGTNLLTADEARQMIEHLLADEAQEVLPDTITVSKPMLDNLMKYLIEYLAEHRTFQDVSDPYRFKLTEAYADMKRHLKEFE
jgi:Holliday junction resolvase RusA-like endonuclease